MGDTRKEKGCPHCAEHEETEDCKEILASEQETLEGVSCCHVKQRSEKEYKDLIHRLNRVEGQIRGIRKMLENDAYCIDIINQVSAANAALNSFTKILLANHIYSCVTDDVKAGNHEKTDELVRTLQKLMK